MNAAPNNREAAAGTLLALLACDTAGNTIAMIAACLFPLLALVGGGVDMGRSYLAESRLQQACDAGVLAVRKKLGTQVVTTGTIPGDVATVGNSFFDVNFIAGSYGTKNRAFTMTLENDYAITGDASVDVPTTIMTIFGYSNMDVTVKCQSRLNFSNLDIVMALDVTGSMGRTNPGDTNSRISSLRTVIKDFYGQVSGSSKPGTRIRYGFVPYASNVNVGHLLKDEWVVDEWTYQSREVDPVNLSSDTTTYWEYKSGISGSRSNWIEQSRTAADVSPEDGSLYCGGALPASTHTWTETPNGTATTEPFVGPPAGVLTREPFIVRQTGSKYRWSLQGNECVLQKATWTDDTADWDRVTRQLEQWIYRPIWRSVADWRTETAGCMEERDTYEIDDYSDVDLKKARDLDINSVPTSSTATQWRPMYPWLIYGRAKTWSNFNSTGAWSTAPVSTRADYIDTGNAWWSHCPAAARQLDAITSTDLSAYLDSLRPYGATYHDIGMIWAGRMISPKGLFKTENKEMAGKPTSRHVIFLTDGQTEPYEWAYTTYGLEPLDERRWTPSSPMSLEETVNERFAFACDEVKKQNVTVWVIAFGTSVNDYMTRCAGTGHYFEAADSAKLQEAFSSIASQLGDLRISK